MFYRSTCDTVRSLPLNIVHQSSLQQQVPFGEEVVADQILIGSHCHPVTDAEGTQHIQNLREQKEQSDASGLFCLQIKPVFIYAMSERVKHMQHHLAVSVSHLVVAPVLVEQRDDGFDVPSLDDVQSLRALHQDTVEDFQDP